MSDLTDINQIGRVAPRTPERPDRTNGNIKPESEAAAEGRTPDPALALEIATKAQSSAEERAAHDEGISTDELLDPVAQHIKEIGQDESHPLYLRAIGKAAWGRTPFGDRNPKLAAPLRKGFHRHWFIDKPGRIGNALRAGWKFVKDDISGKNMERVTGNFQSETKDGQRSFYMEMPQEWYEADQNATLKSVAETEATIRRGEVATGDGKYVPLDAAGRMMVQMQVERHGSALAPLVPTPR